jgi:hypothetical protein
MLMDVGTVIDRAPSGTVLAVSVQCQSAPEVTAAEQDRDGPSAIDRFRDAFGRERVGQEVSEGDLLGWPYGKLVRSMIASEIAAGLAVRNGKVEGPDLLAFHPICEIEYEDGARMTTLVGLLVSTQDANRVAGCSFDQLDFLPETGKLVRIKVPKLTVREVRKLEQHFPRIKKATFELGSIPASDAKAFADLYRYLPNFAVLEPYVFDSVSAFLQLMLGRPYPTAHLFTASRPASVSPYTPRSTRANQP